MNPRLLGKLPPRHDPRTLKLSRYLKGLPAAPVNQDWTPAVKTWQMFGNDSCGDCTIASGLHLQNCWSANAGPSEELFTDQDAVSIYSALTGYNPADPSTDNGAAVLDVLNFWRATGFDGFKIKAFALVNWLNPLELKQAIDLFGGVYAGFAMPLSANEQTGSLWDVTSASPGDAGSWGGHALPLLGYDKETVTTVTWGAVQEMSWKFLETYCDEAYAVISVDWLEAGGSAPSGLDLATLLLDVAQLDD
jgi:hypothetical protein